MLKLKSSNNHDNDYLIKKILKQYKSIELALNKFNSKKYNNGSFANLKGNILRMSLLPFLRNHSLLSQQFSVNSPIYKSLSSVIVLILFKWWSSLLNNLTESLPSNSGLVTLPMGYISPILTSDRNAYLEGISRIISLEYWRTTDLDLYKQYQKLLVVTLEFCLDKMSTLKNLSLAVSAFIGKVFAYSCFNLPDIGHALLFLLGIKQDRLEKTNVLLKLIPPPVKFRNRKLFSTGNLPSLNETSATFSTSKSPFGQSSESQSQTDAFPEYLRWLVNFKGINCPKRQKSILNCLPLPKHPVNGINDPNGNWVRRWCNCDSNVFNSFFRHYIRIVSENYGDCTNLANCPGFAIILSHIIQIFQISITRISNNTKPQLAPPKKVVNQLPLPDVSPLKTSNIYYKSMIKFFKTMRDISYTVQVEPNTFPASSTSTSTSSSNSSISLSALASNSVSSSKCFSDQLIRHIDSALISIANETDVFDTNKSSLILSFTYEFVNHIVNNILNSSDLINWEFWLSCCYMMVKTTDHIQIILKNFAFLFNIWDMIPDALPNKANFDSSSCYDWITNKNETFKLNFINWLINDDNFSRFMTHWSPAIRAYYLRLLIWRVIGINNSQSSMSMEVTKRLQTNIFIAHDVLQEFTLKYQNVYDLNYKAGNPLVNRKFGILPLNIKDEYISVGDDVNSTLMAATPIKAFEIRKTHPYEIFDEAVYTCSSLPSSSPTSSEDCLENEGADNKKNGHNPFVNSLGRLFRILSDDSSRTPNRKAHNKSLSNLASANSNQPFKRNSRSLTSLSTASIKSLPSSPSIMSFRSNSNSATETSPTSSIRDPDSDTNSILSIDLVNQDSNIYSQPSEFLKLPPEIVRPMYKFDIIMDHESMNDKLNLISNKNNRLQNGHERILCQQNITRETSYFPKCPQVPLITIFVNSDVYDTKFYLDDEDNYILENMEFDKQKQRNEGFFDSITKSFSNDVQGLRERDLIKLINLGRSLNEMSTIIDEFKNYLDSRIRIDQFNLDFQIEKNFNDFNYFHKIIPLLSFDTSNESKLLNAS